MKWLKCLILVGFDDMGYDMGLGREDWVFWLILLEILEIRFLSWCVKESAIWIPGKTSCGSGFCHPYTLQLRYFYIFPWSNKCFIKSSWTIRVAHNRTSVWIIILSYFWDLLLTTLINYSILQFVTSKYSFFKKLQKVVDNYNKL